MGAILEHFHFFHLDNQYWQTGNEHRKMQKRSKDARERARESQKISSTPAYRVKIA